MKVVILAGGMGTRIGEETNIKPKPLVEIGGIPILLHIMRIYSHYGFNEFIICLGYKGYCIKEYFEHLYLHEADVTFDFTRKERRTVHSNNIEPWKVTLVNTGLETQTGGRIKRVQRYIGNEPFMLTYGDGVADVDIPRLIETHKDIGKMITITAAQPAGRFGFIDIDEMDSVKTFREKSKLDQGWVNAGFMVIEPDIFDRILSDRYSLEQNILNVGAEHGRIAAYKHYGFFSPMDTIRDKNYLEELWNTNKAPWKMQK